MKRKGYRSIKDFQGKLKVASKEKGEKKGAEDQLTAGASGLGNAVLHAAVVLLSVLVLLLLNVIDYPKLQSHLRFLRF
jgi:hypothetical protein